MQDQLWKRLGETLMPTWAGGWYTLVLVDSKMEVGANSEEVYVPHPLD